MVPMAPVALFLLSSHGQSTAFGGAPLASPLSSITEASGFAFVLLAAALIVTAVERWREG